MKKEEVKNLQEGQKLLTEINRLRKQLGEAPLIFDESLEDNIKNLPGLLAETRDRIREAAGSMTDLYDRLKAATSEIKGQKKPLTDIRRSYRNLTEDVNKLRQDELGISKLNLKQLESLKKRVTLNSNIIADQSKALLADKTKDDLEAKALESINKEIKAKGDLSKLTQEEKNSLIDTISKTKGLSNENKALLSTYIDESNLLESINGKLEERLKTEKELVKTYQKFTIAKDAVKEIPFLGKILSGPFVDAENAAKEMANQTEDSSKVTAAGLKAMSEGFGDMFNTPLGQLGLFAAAFNAFKSLAFEVSKEVTELGKSMGMVQAEAGKVRTELYLSAISTSDAVITTRRLVKAHGELAKSVGATRGFRIDELKAQARLVGRMGMQEESAGRLANLSRLNGKNAEDGLDSIIGSTQALMRQEGIQLDIREVAEEVANTGGQIASQYKNNPKLIGQAVVQARRLGLELSKTKDISGSLLDFESSITNELEAELLIGKQLNFEKARTLALQGKFVESTAEIVKQVGTLDDFQKLNIIQQNALAKAAGMTSDEMNDMLRQQKNLTLLGKETRDQIKKRVEQLIKEGKTEEANNLMRKSGSDEQAKAAMMQLDAQQQFALAVEKVKDVFTVLGNNMTVVLGILGAIAGIMAAIAISSIIASGGLALAGAMGAMAVFGIGGALVGSSLSGGAVGTGTSVSGEADKEPVKVNDFILETNKKDSFALVGGTSLSSNDKSIKEMASDMKSLVKEMKKSTVLNINSNTLVQKAILTSYK